MSISVLMSVYNKENPTFLDLSLQSIWFDQVLKPNEVVLIEDGPLCHELSAVISKWENILKEKLVIIKNDVNIGLTKSLNEGIKIAHGDYIARMDTDDISHSLRFKLQKEFLDSNPEYDIIGGCIQEFDKNNECLAIRHYPKKDHDVRKYIYKASPLAHPAVMMRKSIFENGIEYNEQYRTSQDIALWFDILSAGYKIANLDDIVLYFRREEDVFKRRGRNKAFNEFKIYISGIKHLYGPVTFKYAFPVARFLFRMLPIPMLKFVYKNKIRENFLNNH